MATKRRTHRIEKLSRIYDEQIVPIWSERFGRLLLRDLKIPPRGQILDVACGTGYPATELVQRMGDDSRLIAIDAHSAMLDVARKKLEKLGHKGVFVRSESAEPNLSFTADVYDLVLSNLGIMEMSNPEAALTDFARVAKPGGEVRVTLPVAGSFAEFYDIYREVLVKHDKQETLVRLAEHEEERYPSLERCEKWLQGAGLEDTRIWTEEFTLLFRSSREFFFAPIVEYGPLASWKAVAGTGQEMQDVFWYIKEAIDAYFDGRAFEVTIKAACLVGRVSEAKPDEPKEDSVVDIAVDTSAFDDGTTEVSEALDGGTTVDDDTETVDPDTLDPTTEDFPETLAGLPFIRPLGEDDDNEEN